MKLTAAALNHLLRQNTWAADELRPFTGKTIRITLPPMQSTLTLDGAGEFSAATPDAIVDAEIQLTASAALRMLMQPESSTSLATMQGDTELASAVGKVLQGLRWDAEEDLGRVVGDIPANQLAQAGARIRQAISRQAFSIAGMFAEYWLEEQPMIAKGRHLTRFSHDVDVLREDAERLAKRLEVLERQQG